MVAQPASVPAARRFVDEALTGWGNRELVDDVGLCVTELSTNAMLHSASHYFEIELQKIADAVRVSVLDAGRVPADAIAARTKFSDALVEDLSADDASTTGRGMFIVSALADSWGIDELPEGKRVWAEFGEAESTYDVRPPVVNHRATPFPVEKQDPDDWVVVRFDQCPAALLLAHDDNLAETIRELQLIGADLRQPQFQKLAELMADHVQQHAVNWDAARIQALEAVRAGREFTDIHVLSHKRVMDDVRHLRKMIGEAEALSDSGKLMTMPASPDIQVLRDWLETEFCRQAEQGLGPVAYPTWLAHRNQTQV